MNVNNLETANIWKKKKKTHQTECHTGISVSLTGGFRNMVQKSMGQKQLTLAFFIFIFVFLRGKNGTQQTTTKNNKQQKNIKGETMMKIKTGKYFEVINQQLKICYIIIIFLFVNVLDLWDGRRRDGWRWQRRRNSNAMRNRIDTAYCYSYG